MLARLLFLFTVVPLIELAILIPLGQWMGFWPTLALVMVTGVTGAWLGKRQGLRAWGRITEDLSSGKLPSDSLLDGLAVLIACAFLVTPGVLTDIAGMILLIPPAREPVKSYIKKRFEKSIDSGSVNFVSFDDVDPFGGMGAPPGQDASDEVIDVTPEVVEPDEQTQSSNEEDEKPKVIEIED